MVMGYSGKVGFKIHFSGIDVSDGFRAFAGLNPSVVVHSLSAHMIATPVRVGNPIAPCVLEETLLVHDVCGASAIDEYTLGMSSVSWPISLWNSQNVFGFLEDLGFNCFGCTMSMASVSNTRDGDFDNAHELPLSRACCPSRGCRRIASLYCLSLGMELHGWILDHIPWSLDLFSLALTDTCPVSLCSFFSVTRWSDSAFSVRTNIFAAVMISLQVFGMPSLPVRQRINSSLRAP
ncbi:hypothetical protein L1987_47165 [Smallanthus sonchifolius]|uniref:Uncharacterized protein n=1 Tax=Smallanthus sonchifolius TaxID=185202 RepID=A0ACB9G2S9_9ASTR|nr:hypothetical protein L1987_47165 [Smallanthus sonchifolius]